jgi:hypothetical protein
MVPPVASETSRGGTPVLDRETAIPPRAAPGSGLTVILVVWLGAVVLVAACWVLDRPPILRHWLLTDLRPWCLDQWERIGFVGVAVGLLREYGLPCAVV